GAGIHAGRQFVRGRGHFHPLDLQVEFAARLVLQQDGAGAIGAHKTSMLQDLERGRPMEIDALVTVVQELGRLTGIATPAIDLVLALVRQRARLLGCYP
ncbi:MAG: hypothetical protein F9K43_27495, partial [Bauldia sp.]